MKWLLKLFKGSIIGLLTAHQTEIITLLNEKIDLPKMNEEKEKVIFTKIFEAFKMIIITYL